MNPGLLKRVEAAKVVPVIQLENTEMALPLAEALINNGLPIVEITLRSSAALESIAVIAKEYPEMLLIAGTVLSPEQARQAKEAGAHLVVSSGFSLNMIEYCLENNIDIIPGVMVPGEIEQVMSLGINVVKFFPAEATCGTAFLKSASVSDKTLNIMATGEKTPNNIVDYLLLKLVTCCGGSWVVSPELIKKRNWNELGNLIRETVELSQK